MYFYKSVYLPSRKIKHVHNPMSIIIKQGSIENTKQFFYAQTHALRQHIIELTESNGFIDKNTQSILLLLKKCREFILKAVKFLNFIIGISLGLTQKYAVFTGASALFRCAGGKDPPEICFSRKASYMKHVQNMILTGIILIMGLGLFAQSNSNNIERNIINQSKNQTNFELKTHTKTGCKSNEKNTVSGFFSTTQDTVDEAVIRVDTINYSSADIRDPNVNWTYKCLPLSITMNDNMNSSNPWRLINYSGPAFENGNPPIRDGPIIHTNEFIAPEFAETEYVITYMRPDFEGAPSGAIATIDEEVDRYINQFIVNYRANDQPFSINFEMPNSGAKKVFGWNPDEPIPFHPAYGFDRVNNPAEFEDAMIELGDLLSNPDYAVVDQRVTNRNTSSPCPDPNPWDATADILIALGVDPMAVDDLYPVSIGTEMTEFSKANAPSTPPLAKSPTTDYKSSTLLDGLVFDPPMPDDTIPANARWGHTYNITMDESNTSPEIIVSGMSGNVEYSTIIKQTGDKTYDVTVILNAGGEVTEETLNMDFSTIVGLNEPPLPAVSAGQNFPNPFTNSTSIKYSLDDAVDMTINIYDLNGRLVRTLLNEKQYQGSHTVTWDGKTENGMNAAQGMYIMDINGMQKIKTMKLR